MNNINAFKKILDVPETRWKREKRGRAFSKAKSKVRNTKYLTHYNKRKKKQLICWLHVHSDIEQYLGKMKMKRNDQPLTETDNINKPTDQM